MEITESKLRELAEGDCDCRRKPKSVQEMAGYFCVSREAIYQKLKKWNIKRKCQIGGR